MLAFEAFQMFSALHLHFTSDYDYFKYGGRVRGKIENFEKRKDRALFARVAQKYNPETLITGSVMLGDVKHITGCSEQYQTQFEKYLDNGSYLFSEDIKKLRDDFNSNFTVDQNNNIPYSIKLWTDGEVSYHTCCVLETLLNSDAKWRMKDQYFIFGNLSKKIVKGAPFFNIDHDKYKALLLKRF